MEWSLNIESEEFIEFSLLWLIWHVILIDDVPFLVDCLGLVAHLENLSIGILDAVKILSSLVDEVDTLVSEELPPSS